jgi:hypothetical protein
MNNEDYQINMIGGTFPGLQAKFGNRDFKVRGGFDSRRLPRITDNTTEEAIGFLLNLFEEIEEQHESRVIIDGTFLFFLFASCSDVHDGSFNEAVDRVVESIRTLLDKMQDMDVYIILDGPESPDAIIKSKVLRSSRELESLLGPNGMDKYSTAPIARSANSTFQDRFQKKYPEKVRIADKEGDSYVFELGKELYDEDIEADKAGKRYICMTVDGDVPIIATMMSHLDERHIESNPYIMMVKPVIDQISKILFLDVAKMSNIMSRKTIANMLFHNATDAGYGLSAKDIPDFKPIDTIDVAIDDRMMNVMKKVVATFALIKVGYEIDITKYFNRMIDDAVLEDVDKLVNDTQMLCSNDRYDEEDMNIVLTLLFDIQNDSKDTKVMPLMPMICGAHAELMNIETKLGQIYDITKERNIYSVFFIHPNILHNQIISFPYEYSENEAPSMLTTLYGYDEDVSQKFSTMLENLQYASSILRRFQDRDYLAPIVGDSIHNKFLPIYTDVLDDSIAYLGCLRDEHRFEYDHQKISDRYLILLAGYKYLMSFVCIKNLKRESHNPNCRFRHLYSDQNSSSYGGSIDQQTLEYKLKKYETLLGGAAQNRVSYDLYRAKVGYYRSLF